MIDIIGKIYDPGTYDADGNELTPPVEQDGYHVNALSPIPGCEEYVINPITPCRVYAGVEIEDTIFYKFPDKETWSLFDPRAEGVMHETEL